jgi:hypothetical protein
LVSIVVTFFIGRFVIEYIYTDEKYKQKSKIDNNIISDEEKMSGYFNHRFMRLHRKMTDLVFDKIEKQIDSSLVLLLFVSCADFSLCLICSSNFFNFSSLARSSQSLTSLVLAVLSFSFVAGFCLSFM